MKNLELQRDISKEKIIDKETFQIVYKEMDELTEEQWREQYLNNIP